MSRTLNPASTQSSVLRSARLSIVAAIGLFTSTVLADDPPKPEPAEPVLNLADGGSLVGTLHDCDRLHRVLWKSPSFVKPFEFPIGGLLSIRYPTPEKLPRPSGLFGFELSGGDVLYGSIIGLDDKVAELDVSKLGRISVDRSRLRRIFRWRDGADLIYNGPNGMAGWRDIPAKKKKAQPQQGAMMGAVMMRGAAAPAAPAAQAKPVGPAGPAWSEEGGQLASTRDGAVAQVSVELPIKSTIELDLSWKNKPDFTLALAFTDDEDSLDRAFRFEVWDSEIVVYRVLDKTAKLVSVQTLKDGPGRMQVQLFLDQEQGKLIIFSGNGESIGELKLGGRTGPPAGNVRLTNVRGDIRLERLRIGRWDGETPRPLANDLSRVLLTDLMIVKGGVERFDSATHEFVIKGESGETRVNEDKVSNVLFAREEDNAPRAVRAIYQDGTRIGGDWVKVEGGSLVLTVPGISGALRLNMDGLRSLDMLPQEGNVVEGPPGSGTLEMDGFRIRGRLTNSEEGEGAAPLNFRPLGAESSSPLRPGASGKIVYKTPTPPPQPTPAQQAAAQRAQLRAAGGVNNVGAANVIGGFIDSFQTLPKQSGSRRRSLYLRSGDIVPAEVVKIDENGVTFKTDLSPSSFVPHAQIKAVELASETGAVIRLNKTKFDRLMTLPRMQRDSPPTQLIRSKNGDMLRARILSMDDKTIRIEVRLEEKEIPRDRVSRIIWLHPDETDPSKKKPEPAEATGNRVQAVRSDGIRLTFFADRFLDDSLLGKSTVLGECKVRMKDLDSLLIGGAVEKEATQLAYQNWKLQNAPEPKSAQMDDDGSPGGNSGTESALVGKPAPDFELDLVGGKKFHLAENKGKIIVLDFWATWCGPCIQAMPQIEKVTQEFVDKGVQLIAVNLQETPDKIKAMLERQKLSPTVALDRDGVVAAKYAANAIPQTVVIDKEGKITRLFIGGGPKLGDQLREALQSLMPETKP